MFHIIRPSRINAKPFAVGCKRFTTETSKSRLQLKNEKERKKLLAVGVPLVLFMLGGTYFLSIFMDTKMEMKDRKMGKSTTIKKFDLEEEHKALMNKLKIEDFSLSRIPRPDDGKSDLKDNSIIHVLVSKPDDAKKEK